MVVDGSFSKGGKKARGWFTVKDAGCSTGQVFWVAKPDSTQLTVQTRHAAITITCSTRRQRLSRR